jgi:hypothetical protein
MEETYFRETMVNVQRTTQRYIPDSGTLQNRKKFLKESYFKRRMSI